jgi:hypothetical protein
MSELVEFKKIREFGEMINDTFLFIRQNLKPMLKAFIYLCGFFILAGIATSIMNQLNMRDAVVNSTNFEERISAVLTLNYLVSIIFLILNYNALTVAILSYVALYIDKGNVSPSIDEVWAYFKYYFFRALVGSVLVGVFMVLAFICCIIPGIYVFPMMSLFFPIMLFENASVGYCFSRSFKLVKDQWWITAAVLIIIWMITYACTLIVAIPSMILGLMTAFTSGSKQISIFSLALISVLQYLSQVFMILPLVCSAFCYFNLRERQESYGLLERIGKLGGPKDNLNAPKEEY